MEAASFRRLRLPAPTSSVAAVITAQVSQTEPPMEPGFSSGSQIAEQIRFVPDTLRPLERCRQDLESGLDAPACASGERGTPSPPTPIARSALPASSSQLACSRRRCVASPASRGAGGMKQTDGAVYVHSDSESSAFPRIFGELFLVKRPNARWRCSGRMADVDSLLSELDGLLEDSPPGKRASAPQRPSAAPAAPRLAPGRPAVEDDIDSLLSSLGGAEAFSSNAASKTTCAPRAACPPSAVPSSSSAPPDGTSCATKYVPAMRLPAPPRVPAHHTHGHALPPPWQLAVQQVRLQGDALRRPEVERVCRLHVLAELHG